MHIPHPFSVHLSSDGHTHGCFVYNQHWHTHLLEFLLSIPLVVTLESKLLGHVAEALLVFRGGLSYISQ